MEDSQNGCETDPDHRGECQAEQRAGVPIRTEIHDRGCPGLFLIVQPSGAKSWALRYRVAGKSRKLTLGGGELALASARTSLRWSRMSPSSGRCSEPIVDGAVQVLQVARRA